MALDIATKVRDTISSSWSWWWEGSNPKDEVARIILTFTVFSITVSWFVWSKKRMSKLPPGPWGLPLVGNLPFLDPEMHTYFAKLTKIYGPIFKVQLGSKLCVVLGSPAMAKEVLKDNDTIFANRDPPLSGLAITYGGFDLAWAPYGPEWRMLHMVFVREVLSKTSLDRVYVLRREEVHRTVSDVYSKIGTPINVAEQMFLTMLNVLTSMLWGGTLKREERNSIGAEFQQVIEEIVFLLGKTNVSDLFPLLARFDIQGVERKMKRNLLWFDRIFDSIIDQRTKLDQATTIGDNHRKESIDFLEVLLQLKDQRDPKTPFTITHLKALFMDAVVAGTETTATTVEWTMAEMMNNRNIMTTAQEELDKVVGRNNRVEESHLPKLRYLDAVVMESLRLHPVIPLLVPRRPSKSCTVGGYTIPAGTKIMINAWAIQRDAEHWENPLKFQPERFLDDTSKWDYNGNDFRYIPFGSGRRICVGIPLVKRMVPFMLASLVHSFEWEVPEGTSLDLSDKFGIVLKKRSPLHLIPKPRLSDSELYG